MRVGIALQKDCKQRSHIARDMHFRRVGLDEPSNGQKVLLQSWLVRFDAECVCEHSGKRSLERVSPIHPITRLSRAHSRVRTQCE